MRKPGSLLIVAALCLSFLAGCAGIRNMLGPSVLTAEEEAKKEDAKARSAAIREYRYQELRDELIVEKPRLSAPAVSRGGELLQEVKFTVLSPEGSKTFMVTETTILSGAGINMELSRKEGKRRQGSHESTLRIVIPKDLPLGEYTISTTIATDVQSYRQTSTFTVTK